MSTSTVREREGARSPEERRLRPRLTLPRTCGLLVAIVIAATGCGKPPTWEELIHGKKEEKPAAPVAGKPAAPQPTQTYTPPKPPEPPKRTPQEIIAQFVNTPPERHNDQQLTELSGISEGLDQFTAMDVSSSSVSDAGIAVLPKFERLEALTIDNCQYSSNGLKSVAQIKSLNTLSMKGGPIRDQSADAGLAIVKGMNQITNLRIDRNRFTMEGLANVGGMTWLERLSVADTNFNAAHLKLLGHLTNLKELDISNTGIDDAAFEWLLPFKNLEVLEIASLRSNFTGQGLKDLVLSGGLGHLKTLVLFRNKNLSLPAYEAINRLKTLEVLELSETGTNDAFLPALKGLGKLEALFLGRNPDITSGGLQVLRSFNKKLKKLVLENNPRVTDDALNYVAQCKNLESFVAWDTAITQPAIRKLKRMLPKCAISYNRQNIE